MANPEHLEILRQGVEVWNQWRKIHHAPPDLSGADLSSFTLTDFDLSFANLDSVNLSLANLSFANFNRANLKNANLQSTVLNNADLRFANLSCVDLKFADLIEANLSSSNLCGADLSESDLSHADLRSIRIHRTIFNRVLLIKAILTGTFLGSTPFERANFSEAQLGRANLTYANLSHADLTEADLRSTLLDNANLNKADLSGANLSYASLSDADLSFSNLHGAQVLEADFKRAVLTGACIADWQIGRLTVLEDVHCDYIYRTIDENGHFSGRLPIDPNSTFAPGEFTQRFQILESALETIDLTFTEGIDWQAFFRAFQELRSQYPSQHITIQGMEEKGNAFVVRLKVETEETGPELEQLKGEIEAAQKALYDNQLLLMKAQGQIEVYQDMMGVVKTLAAKPMAEVNQNFHGPVGNVAGTNYGSMTAYINQNSADINHLLTALRETAQQFPEAQRDEALMELDDLEADLKAPEKQEPKRIGKRLQRLMAAGTAAATLAGGAATFSGNLNDFTTNVLDLTEKLGVPIELVQPNQGTP